MLLQTVTVRFDELDIEGSIRCSDDSVSLYDGRDAKAPLLEKGFCGGRTPPQSLTSSSSAVFVVFRSDKEFNAGRFALSWTFNQGQ